MSTSFLNDKIVPNNYHAATPQPSRVEVNKLQKQTAIGGSILYSWC